MNDLTAYRASPAEQERIEDLFRHVPARGHRALDVGTRDGFLAKLLAKRCSEVVALDLELPAIDHPRIIPVKGNAAALPYPNDHFDIVLCAEVLEHIPPAILPKVCAELRRVAADILVIGVPYRQDLRIGRTVCNKCGAINPPWGHVNSFDEGRLNELFGPMKFSYVGSTRASTNQVATALMDFAGNPFGTWDQDEPCVKCGGKIGTPKARNVPQKLAARAAVMLNDLQSRFTPARANWIHGSAEV